MQGDKIRVELGDRLVLIQADKNDFIILDVHKKRGIENKQADENRSLFSMRSAGDIFPLWPTNYAATDDGSDGWQNLIPIYQNYKEEFVGKPNEIAIKKITYNPPVIVHHSQKIIYTWMVVPLEGLIPQNIAWSVEDTATNMKWSMFYFSNFKPIDKAPPFAFEAPKGYKIQVLNGFSTPDKWLQGTFKNTIDANDWILSCYADEYQAATKPILKKKPSTKKK